MDSLVKPRPNHYQLLGLTPGATDEEIALAFAREISPLRPHAFGDIALLSVAHETLRDPARRRAYDASIGLAPKAKPARPLQGWQYSSPVRVTASAAPISPPVTTKPAEPVEQAPPPQPAPAAAAQPRRDWIEPRPVPLRHIRPQDDDEPAEWKRPAIIAGGIFAAVGVIGVLAGLWAARDVQSKIPSDALEIPAPAEARTAPPRLSQLTVPEAQPQSPARSAVVPAKARQRTTPKPIEAPEQRADDVPEIPSEQVAALAAQSDEAPATLPLSNATIARTIGRIGYSCGQVASTEAVEGELGVFKVTCTSGQSYKAAPVRGRYHFRRWAG
jgi:hypothetical protein